MIRVGFARTRRRASRIPAAKTAAAAVPATPAQSPIGGPPPSCRRSEEPSCHGISAPALAAGAARGAAASAGLGLPRSAGRTLVRSGRVARPPAADARTARSSGWCGVTRRRLVRALRTLGTAFDDGAGWAGSDLNEPGRLRSRGRPRWRDPCGRAGCSTEAGCSAAAGCCGATAAGGAGVAGCAGGSTLAGAGAAGRGGRNASGSRYPWGSEALRIPRWTWGSASSGSPLGPTVPTTAPSATSTPFATT
jgi:hypothetical protein